MVFLSLQVNNGNALKVILRKNTIFFSISNAMFQWRLRSIFVLLKFLVFHYPRHLLQMQNTESLPVSKLIILVFLLSVIPQQSLFIAQPLNLLLLNKKLTSISCEELFVKNYMAPNQKYMLYKGNFGGVPKFQNSDCFLSGCAI